MISIFFNEDCTPRKRGWPKKAAICLEDHYPEIKYSAVDQNEESSSKGDAKPKAQATSFSTTNENICTTEAYLTWCYISAKHLE